MKEVTQYLGHSNLNVTCLTSARFSPGHLQKTADVPELERLGAIQAPPSNEA